MVSGRRGWQGVVLGNTPLCTCPGVQGCSFSSPMGASLVQASFLEGSQHLALRLSSLCPTSNQRDPSLPTQELPHLPWCSPPHSAPPRDSLLWHCHPPSSHLHPWQFCTLTPPPTCQKCLHLHNLLVHTPSLQSSKALLKFSGTPPGPPHPGLETPLCFPWFRSCQACFREH